MRRGVLVHNPSAGGQRFESELRGIVARARAGGLDLDVRPTGAPGAATTIVAQALRSAPDLIVAAGGDGTLREAAAALVGSTVPLAILPAGTANVLAREYGIGVNVRKAERILLSQHTRPLTAWSAGGRSCFMWLGIGLDARVMKNTIPVLKRTLGRVGIGWTAIAEALGYDFPPIGVDGTDGHGAPFTRTATFVVASNIARYGGDPQLSPHADPGDDLLDLTLFTGRTHTALLRFFVHIALGRMRHRPLADVEQFTVRTLAARSLNAVPVDVQVDGDHVGAAHVEIGPALGRVLIVVPE